MINLRSEGGVTVSLIVCRVEVCRRESGLSIGSIILKARVDQNSESPTATIEEYQNEHDVITDLRGATFEPTIFALSRVIKDGNLVCFFDIKAIYRDDNDENVAELYRELSSAN